MEALSRIGGRAAPESCAEASTTSAAPETLESAVARDYARIRRLARMFGILESDADDAAQEVFAKAWTHRGTFDGRSSFSTWVTRIALNHFSSVLRRERVMRLWLTREEQRPARRLPDPRVQAETREAYALASGLIRELPRKQREAFVLRHLEELSYGEIAALLQITEGTARARTFEARGKLRRMLGEYEL